MRLRHLVCRLALLLGCVRGGEGWCWHVVTDSGYCPHFSNPDSKKTPRPLARGFCQHPRRAPWWLNHTHNMGQFNPWPGAGCGGQNRVKGPF